MDVQAVIRVRGPGSEAVADREVTRRGHRAGDLVQSPGAGLDGQDRAQQAARVLVGGVHEQLLRGRLLDDLTGVHDRNVVGHLGDERQVVAPVSATALYGWMPLSPFLLALSLVTLSCSCAWLLLRRLDIVSRAHD